MGLNPKCPGSNWGKNQVQIYLRHVFLPPPSPVLANIHSILAYDVPGTEDVGLPTKFRFNVGPTLQPIAGLMPVTCLRRWPNTNLSPGLLYTLHKHVAFNQCCFNVDPQCSTLARHWNSNGLQRLFWRFNIPASEIPDNTILWPNADVMLDHRLRRWANIIPTKTLWALNHKYDRE